MRLVSCRGVLITCSPLLLLALPAAYVAMGAQQLACAFIALSVHECAHAAAARRAGCRVESMEIQPFGFVARIDCRYASPHDSAAIFAAGPVASLCLAAAAALITSYVPLPRATAALLSRFSSQNLVIAFVNLMPALPLDGGRIVRALLGFESAYTKKNKERLASRVLAAMGLTVGALLVAAFAVLAHSGSLNPTLPIMGVFLMIAAVKELSSRDIPAVRHRHFGEKSMLNVKQIAIGRQATVASALRSLPAGAYAVVSVVDSSMRCMGTLDEGELMLAAQSLGASATLGMAVAYCGKRVL